MNIAVVSAYTENIAELVAPLSANKQEYCDKWGYKFFLDIVPATTVEWSKQNQKTFGLYRIILIKQLMIDHPEIDVFVWMDNDAFVMNFNKPLGDFIIPDIDLLIGEDWNGINVGVFFIRNNEQCRNFLQNVIDYIPPTTDIRPYWWVISEQNSVSELLHTVNTGLVHHSLINGYLIGPRKDNDFRPFGLGPRIRDWQPRSFQLGDFALHLVGEHNENKPTLIKEYLEKVIK